MPIETIFSLIIAVAMICAPLYFLSDWRKSQRRTEVALGRVVDHEEKTVETRIGSAVSGRAQTDHAIIEFEVDGQTHTLVASEGASWKIHPPGSEQWICYDPDDPNNADVLPGALTKMVYFIGFVALPVTGLIILIRL